MSQDRATLIRWRIVIFLIGFTFLAHFNRINISVVGGERFIGEDRLTKSEMGWVYSTALLVYTIGMLPGGWLIDRVGPRWALAGMGIGLGTFGIATGLLGWAGLAIPALLAPLLVIRGFVGAASVPLHPASARAVSLWLPIAKRSTANGLVTAGALVGIALTYPVFGFLMDRFDWPMGFVISGAALLIWASAWTFLAADNPERHSATNAAERALIAEGRATPKPVAASVGDMIELIQNRRLILITLSYGAVGYFQYLFFYWMSFYFEDVLKLSAVDSRQAAMIVSLASAVGMIAGGWLADFLCRRIGQYVGCLTMAVVGMGACAGFGWLGVEATDPDRVVLFFSLALGSLGLCEAIFWTTAPLLAPRNGGLACALLNTGGNGMGLLAPIVTPVIADVYGWKTAIALACGVSFVGGLLWLGIRPANDTQSD